MEFRPRMKAPRIGKSYRLRGCLGLYGCTKAAVHMSSDFLLNSPFSSVCRCIKSGWCFSSMHCHLLPLLLHGFYTWVGLLSSKKLRANNNIDAFADVMIPFMIIAYKLGVVLTSIFTFYLYTVKVLIFTKSADFLFWKIFFGDFM